jgi:hypothetical protein
MRLLASVLLCALLAASIAPADEKSDAAAMAEWKRETAQRQAKLAAEFAALMAGVTELEVFILDPQSGWEEASKRAKDPSPRLDRWKIVRGAKVTDAREIAVLCAGIQRSIETGGPVAACFNPRHGVRFIRNDQPVELILCFECASMDAKGSPEFEGGAISAAAEVAFYRVFRAHGLVRPPQLQGTSDAEIARMLVGEWTSTGTWKKGGASLTWKSLRTFAADGSYSYESETTVVFDVGEPSGPLHPRETGRWRVEDGLLLMFREVDPEDMFDESVDYGIPLLKVSPDGIVLGSTSVEKADQETVMRRK